MADVLIDPFEPDGPFWSVGTMAVSCAVRWMKDRRQVLRELLDGHEIARSVDRELLWIAGIITSPRENPPSVSGQIFREIVTHILEDE